MRIWSKTFIAAAVALATASPAGAESLEGRWTATVTVNGTGELVRVKIRADSFDPADTEDLEDLIVAAYRDARARSDAMAAEAFGPLTGGLGALGGGQGDGGPGSPIGF